ncbi:hypothetical protein GGTG_14387 [Gaeumannomyces tritici R3-111a-1]|uniref:Uncharacterized protein n=1 Tax=Gaeumannomyces tritici (strain R3-111a-1) TaxID=644352 RepID=J3PLC4_GAET3|nr:hypothetical protein GGTG_14387 [Gaeumannomyces tritici R3-111a-1]EJT68034.1 hypothetical protein GGTG_14387 [Gaeumannomyces tritici R3-111a-1]
MARIRSQSPSFPDPVGDDDAGCRVPNAQLVGALAVVAVPHAQVPDDGRVHLGGRGRRASCTGLASAAKHCQLRSLVGGRGGAAAVDDAEEEDDGDLDDGLHQPFSGCRSISTSSRSTPRAGRRALPASSAGTAVAPLSRVWPNSPVGSSARAAG